MASGIYTQVKADWWNKNIDMVNDVIKVALLDNSHSFTATDTTWADVSANEVSGAGYVAGGATLSGKSVTEGTATKFDASNVTWSSITTTAYHAVLYDTTVSNNLICSIDLGGAQTVTATDLIIDWNANGILTLTTG